MQVKGKGLLWGTVNITSKGPVFQSEDKKWTVQIHNGAVMTRDSSLSGSVQVSTTNGSSFDTLGGSPLQDGDSVIASFPDGTFVQGKVTIKTEGTYRRSYLSKEDGVLVSLQREGVKAQRTT